MKSDEITPESIKEMGKMWEDAILSKMSLEERLKSFKPEDVLKSFKPEEIEAYLRKIKKSRQ